MGIKLIKIMFSLTFWCFVTSMYEGERGAYRVLVGRSENRSPLGRLRHRWENNIKVHFPEVEGGAWTALL
jgi:hypothetical protein